MNTDTQKNVSSRHKGARGLYVRLAFQNLLRRPARTLMLMLSVTICTAAVFASFTVARGIESSMEQSFSRMGADLIVVPPEAMVNITSALLTVQPTEALLDEKLIDQIRHLDGVSHVAPQTIYHVPIMATMPGHKANLIAFDPKADFTVLPWLDAKLPRSMKTGELIAGGRRDESIGDEVEPGGKAANIYGKLARSGVGPFDESFFAPYETVSGLIGNNNGASSRLSMRPSALLVRLAFGATTEQIRFSIAKLANVKVVTGPRIVTSTRQTTKVLIDGMKGFTVLMLIGLLILIGLLFSAIIAERGREIGLLRAIGSRRLDNVNMLIAEAALTTGFGGVCGIALGGILLLAFQHSLVYYLENLHVEFLWPTLAQIAASALGCATLASAVGLIGAFLPAWNASGKEAYLLIQGEGK